MILINHDYPPSALGSPEEKEERRERRRKKKKEQDRRRTEKNGEERRKKSQIWRNYDNLEAQGMTEKRNTATAPFLKKSRFLIARGAF